LCVMFALDMEIDLMGGWRWLSVKVVVRPWNLIKCCYVISADELLVWILDTIRGYTEFFTYLLKSQGWVCLHSSCVDMVASCVLLLCQWSLVNHKLRCRTLADGWRMSWWMEWEKRTHERDHILYSRLPNLFIDLPFDFVVCARQLARRERWTGGFEVVGAGEW
jgi:hypothetical protein